MMACMSKKKARVPSSPAIFLTTEELAVRWKVHPETIRRRVKAQKLRASSVLGGRFYRFRLSDVEAYEAHADVNADLNYA